MIDHVISVIQKGARNKADNKIFLNITEEEWNVIQAALIKQKPILVNTAKQSEYARQKTAPCRICGHILLKQLYSYCPGCGQKARWE